MLLTLSADQEVFVDTTARFLASTVPPDELRRLRDHDEGFDGDYWRRGAELGWTSLLVDDAHGGGTISGAGMVDLSLVAYEFGRHASPGPLISTNLVAGALSAAGAHLDVAGELLSGTSVAAWCPPVHPGSLDVAPSVRRSGDQVVVRGAVRGVEGAAQAAHLLVTATGDGEGVTQVLVPTSAPGVSVTAMRSVDLTKRFAQVHLDDVVLSADQVVGRPDGGSAVERQLRQCLVLLNAEAVGAMQAAFDLTVEWAFDRYSFGRPLASYQALKHRFADMKCWLEASHAVADAACAALYDDDLDAAELSSAAKAFIGHYGAELLHDCVQLHGGIGVTYEHDLHLFLRRFTLDRALCGTPADHRRQVAGLLERQREAA